jgi:hypothetical protein
MDALFSSNGNAHPTKGFGHSLEEEWKLVRRLNKPASVRFEKRRDLRFNFST